MIDHFFFFHIHPEAGVASGTYYFD